MIDSTNPMYAFLFFFAPYSSSSWSRRAWANAFACFLSRFSSCNAMVIAPIGSYVTHGISQAFKWQKIALDSGLSAAVVFATRGSWPNFLVADWDTYGVPICVLRTLFCGS